MSVVQETSPVDTPTELVVALGLGTRGRPHQRDLAGLRRPDDPSPTLSRFNLGIERLPPHHQSMVPWPPERPTDPSADLSGGPPASTGSGPCPAPTPPPQLGFCLAATNDRCAPRLASPPTAGGHWMRRLSSHTPTPPPATADGGGCGGDGRGSGTRPLRVVPRGGRLSEGPALSGAPARGWIAPPPPRCPSRRSNSREASVQPAAPRLLLRASRSNSITQIPTPLLPSPHHTPWPEARTGRTRGRGRAAFVEAIRLRQEGGGRPGQWAAAGAKEPPPRPPLPLAAATGGGGGGGAPLDGTAAGGGDAGRPRRCAADHPFPTTGPEGMGKGWPVALAVGGGLGPRPTHTTRPPRAPNADSPHHHRPHLHHHHPPPTPPP